MAETNDNVKVFSTPTCPWCQKVKQYLNDQNVDFEDIDVSKDQAMAKKMVQKSGQMGVPQVWIDDQVIVGYNKSVIDDLLNL